LWHVFHGRPLAYPFAEGLETWDATLAGLNHFCWVVELRDRATGRDLIDELRRRLDEGASTGGPLCDEVSRQTGFLLVPGDDHTQDFLPPHPSAARRKTVWHGTPAERRQRLALLADAAAGRAPVEAVTRHSAWEKPVDLIAAMAYGRAVAFRGLNLANDGQVANLPYGVFVETPCVGSPTGPVPEHVTLPEPVLPYCRRAAEVTDTIVRAALQRSRELVHEAVQLDPTITDKGAGLAAIDECLAAHADVLPKYE
jgi:alpha-galactosidase